MAELARRAVERFGRIDVWVNDASVYSHVGAPWLTAYVSSKFAVRGFSEALRRELADLPDVHVCTVSPSPIDTPILAGAANDSGRVVKAPPPTFPPQQVASAILASALHPKRERIVGGAGRSSPPSQLPPPTATRMHPSPTAALRLAAPTRPAASAPLVGRGRTAGRRLTHHRTEDADPR